jgi:hypothetical protein
MLDTLVFFLGPVLVFWGLIAIFFAVLYACKLMTKERAWTNFWLATLLLVAVTIYRVSFLLSDSAVVPGVTAIVLLVVYFALAYWFNLLTKERAWINFWIVLIALIFLVVLRIVEIAYLDVATNLVALPQ